MSGNEKFHVMPYTSEVQKQIRTHLKTIRMPMRELARKLGWHKGGVSRALRANVTVNKIGEVCEAAGLRLAIAEKASGKEVQEPLTSEFLLSLPGASAFRERPSYIIGIKTLVFMITLHERDKYNWNMYLDNKLVIMSATRKHVTNLLESLSGV